AAGVTTLGQVATIHTANGIYGPDAPGNDDQAEIDTFPWADAARWLPEGGPDELAGAEAAVVESALLEELFACGPAEQLGSRDGTGWCGLVRHGVRPGGAVLRQTPYGRRSAWATGSDDELAQAWEEAHREHQAYQDATEGNRGEAASGLAPEIWV